MGVHHVERTVGFVEPVQVGDPERHRCRRRAGLLDDRCRRGGADPHHPTGRHPAGEVSGDRARTAPDVEQVEPGTKVIEQVGGRVLGRAPAVRAEDAVVVAVGVGHGVHSWAWPGAGATEIGAMMWPQ